MPEGTYEKGVAGEEQALEYLLKRGMKPLCRRYHSPFGEIDLIMLDGDVIAFVEVKLRLTGGVGSGARAVSREKQRKIIKTARLFAQERALDAMMRFDVLEISREGVWYIQNAFEASAWA